MYKFENPTTGEKEELPIHFDKDGAVKVDIEPFIKDRKKNLINYIIRPEDIDSEGQGGESLESMEKVKKSLKIQLQEMIDFLATTENDEASAKEYYESLYTPIISEVEKSNDLEEIYNILQKVRFEDINARYHEIMPGTLRTFYVPKGRGKDININVSKDPAVTRVLDIKDRIRVFLLNKKVLTENRENK